MARMARATQDDIAATPGVGQQLARAIHERLTSVEPAGRRSA
jgi:hypothetical protein